MKAYAAIHTAAPLSQAHNEASYKGYHRVPVECEIGSIKFHVQFPEVEEDTALVMTHISIGSQEEGDGEIFLSLRATPDVPLKVMQPGKCPNVTIFYPDTLAKSARIAHQMVALGRVRTSEMEPKFFERLNDEFQAHGIPILTVTRGAAAGWVGKMANMPSLNSVN